MDQHVVPFDKDMADAELIIPAFLEKEITEKFYFKIEYCPCEKLLAAPISEAADLPVCDHAHFKMVRLDIPIQETRIEQEMVWLSNWG